MTARRQLRTGLLIAAVVALSGTIWINRAHFTPLDVGSRAPDYTARTLTGEPVALSLFQGQVLLLNVWATWCAPCVREMPALQRLHDRLSPQGLRIVAVSVDPTTSPLAPPGPAGTGVRDFIERFGLTFTVLHDPTGGIQRAFQSPGLPTTYLIDRTGRIRKKIVGAAPWDEPQYADEIRRLLET
jgi:cytochrome c biogenesis protein CcmG, thiol:disulfide interchange protein DsbE